MRLVLELTPHPIEFGQKGDPNAEYPLLVSVGTLRIAARSGEGESSISSGELPSLEVTLDNSGRLAASIIGAPLRARADVYDDDGNLFFAGTVASVSAGRVLRLTLEA
jgi:hypothetical protein